MQEPSRLSVGQRIKLRRERAGMSRSVFGGLVGRSAEWVKAVETGRLLPPRLPMLIRIAQVLGVEDLAELTGEQRLPVASYSKGTHEALPQVAGALTDYLVSARDTEPVPAGALAERVRQAWSLWHGTRRQRTAIAVVLPGLIRDARLAARLHDGQERREALRSLAQVYHLAQLFLSFQPVPELVTLTGDRGMAAAQDADDPRAIAAAAWYVNHVWRDADQAVEAREALARGAAELLRPERDQEELALWGLLQLAVALSCAKRGREGDAWRYWDRAHEAARALGTGYAHPWLIFGLGMVEAYAVTIHDDLTHGGHAVQHAGRIDLGVIPSATRRSFHLAEVARGHWLRREHDATVALLTQAWEVSPDTTRFSRFARAAISELAERGTGDRAPITRLAERLGMHD